MRNKRSITNIKYSEIACISGGGGDCNCWCSDMRPTEKAIVGGECIEAGWAVHKDACVSACTDEGTKWAAYLYSDMEGTLEELMGRFKLDIIAIK
jgi:hypothetical protein